MKARYRDQRREIAAALAELHPGAVAVDVGANKGAYLYWLHRAVGPTGKVFAYEPQPELAAYLKSVCATRRWDNVVVRECALSDRAGVARLNVPGAGVSPGASLSDQPTQAGLGQSYDCEVNTLDAQLQGEECVSLLKVDVEGHELQVFRGAEQVLRKSAPAILFECEARHLASHSMRDVFAFLEKRGYAGVFFSPNGLRPLNEFDPAVHQRQGPGRFWDAANYCNNFLFKAPPKTLACDA